jgi:predicted nucleic acid-binding protein
MVLVDANVLVDVLADDPAWREWSEARLLEIASTEELAINPIIYAELAAAYRSAAALERALSGLGLVRLPLPYEAGFLAAQAFVAYRRGDGTKRSPLPDFHIGAHAQTANLRLLTRDAARYRTYFPKVRLITPD